MLCHHPHEPSLWAAVDGATMTCRRWGMDGLVEHWALLDDECEKVGSKRATQVGVA